MCVCTFADDVLIVQRKTYLVNNLHIWNDIQLHKVAIDNVEQTVNTN